SLLYGALVGGGDRLELQRWSVAGYLQVATKTHGGASVAYLNTMLAPVQLLASASWIDWEDPISGSDYVEQRRTRDASVSAARTWRGDFTASLAAFYTDDYDQGAREHVGGPQLALAWTPSDATRYSGLYRALLVSAAAAYYPRMMSTFTGDI